ncbi:aldolase [Caldimonas sp. KR1-144]|uniref:class II aldolase/adducin family protein n=1 Tax=Caldimonas sp. KR1-144 TaxID=3400911 RepID=UPI003C06916E
MDDATLREEICRVGASLFARGYVHASAGNISARRPGGGFVITPTDACLGTLQPDRLAVIEPDGTQIAGERASKTLALHRRIYEADPEAGCVLHTHATHLVALTLAGVWSAEDIVPPITPYYVMKVGHVPLVAYHRPGDPAVAEQVAALIARSRSVGAPIRGVMLERLGPVVWHRTPAQASAVLEELEETAKLWLQTGRSATALGAAQIDELRQAFGAHW